MVTITEYRKQVLIADYDGDSDVLCVAAGPARPGCGDDGPDDVILRYDAVSHPALPFRATAAAVGGGVSTIWPASLPITLV
jgi:hypothetical protein